MSKHKWTFEEEELSDGMYFTVYDQFGQRLTEPHIDKQDALKIASAPELLQIAKDILSLDFADGLFESDFDAFEAIQAHAKQTIAKAEGA